MSLQSPEYWSARAEERGPVPNTCGMKVDKARCGPLLICMILGASISAVRGYVWRVARAGQTRPANRPITRYPVSYQGRRDGSAGTGHAGQRTWRI